MQVEHSRNNHVQRSQGGTLLGICRSFSMTCINGVITDEDTDRNRGQIRSLLNVTHSSFHNLKAKKIHQNVVRREQRQGFFLSHGFLFFTLFFIYLWFYIYVHLFYPNKTHFLLFLLWAFSLGVSVKRSFILLFLPFTFSLSSLYLSKKFPHLFPNSLLDWEYLDLDESCRSRSNHHQKLCWPTGYSMR